ncbi:hypothetical protein BDV95DRAFT_299434 [Massariosphaeria phaeospora]|uniref:Uncharacterized protein n=1 Tax=Massariosphaeria phaeospora TaxID=100035 RepID=A0A7C8IAM8_9PLEO|nr:hypothetical protein BDV95DRAFT_299434 [Massariosphaeria phaeospora]
MDENMVHTLTTTVDLVAATLDVAPNSWRDHLNAVRNITSILEINDSAPNEARRAWQIPLITVFQRVAYADHDGGGVLDIANWCLRQSVTLLQVYPDDIDLLALIGGNWLLRAQQSLARIHSAERSSSSSGASQTVPLSQSEDDQLAASAAAEAEELLHTADYVEARGILLPAIEYLKRAVDAAQGQGKVTGGLLCSAAEAYMSLGNVTSSRSNNQHFQAALAYLRRATQIHGFSLPEHMQQYLDEFGPLESVG